MVVASGIMMAFELVKKWRLAPAMPCKTRHFWRWPVPVPIYSQALPVPHGPESCLRFHPHVTRNRAEWGVAWTRGDLARAYAEKHARATCRRRLISERDRVEG